jgi:hypothetical protein
VLLFNCNVGGGKNICICIIFFFYFVPQKSIIKKDVT